MKDYFSLAFNNLRRRKLRAWLTMIGIFIGIAAVVALISLGQGLQNAITQQFEQLGSDKIIIMPSVFAPPGSITTESLLLTNKDNEFLRGIRGVEETAGFIMKYGQIGYKDEMKVIAVLGLAPEDEKFWNELNFMKMADGRNYNSGEKYKVVVGYNHAYKDTWDKPIKLGSTIKIEGQEFKVVGIMEKTGDPGNDGSVYIQKETLRELFNAPKEESMIYVKVASGFDPEDVANDIERKLRKFRNEKEGEETFSVQTSEQLLESFQSIFGVVQAVLVGIAGISLVVGGIGIMNTMYTAVLERTKEIGTMKAVGAKNSDILILFLFEAGLLGLVGGAIGIAIGYGLGKTAEILASRALGTDLLQASFPWYLILGALLFSFLVGAAAGVTPAYQASRLKPADALRYE